jgi:hypothetical protein
MRSSYLHKKYAACEFSHSMPREMAVWPLDASLRVIWAKGVKTKLTEGVTRLTCIRELSGSNLRLDTVYPDRGRSGFIVSVYPHKFRNNKPLWIPLGSFRFHHSQIIPLFCAILLSYWQRRKVKHKKFSVAALLIPITTVKHAILATLVSRPPVTVRHIFM